jgi:regulator of replication initiation timing
MVKRLSDDGSEYWVTPPDMYDKLNSEFHFDFDPFPYPWNGVDSTEIEWGKSNYCNPPFRAADGKNGKGPTAFIRKAIEENRKGKTVVVVINTMSFINLLLEAGAEVRSMGRVKWLDGKSGKPWSDPSNTTVFVLRGEKAGGDTEGTPQIATKQRVPVIDQRDNAEEQVRGLKGELAEWKDKYYRSIDANGELLLEIESLKNKLELMHKNFENEVRRHRETLDELNGVLKCGTFGGILHKLREENEQLKENIRLSKR